MEVDGVWVENPNLVKKRIHELFKNRFMDEGMVEFEKVGEEDNDFFCWPFREEEVEEAG